MLDQRTRVSIRRHLGVPFAGTAQAGRLFGWRFMIHVEDLEYKMSNLQPAEEQIITGKAMASWNIGDSPSLGDVLTFIVTDTSGTYSIPYTVTAEDLDPAANIVNPSEAAPTFSIALNASRAINEALQPLGYAASGAMPADLFSPQYIAPYFSEVILTGPSATPPTISSTISGTTNLIVGQQGAPSPIAANLFGSATTTYGYVNILDQLFMGMTQADLSLWLAKADVVNFRPDEIIQRKKLYKTYCEMLSRDLGGKDYINYFFGGGSGGGAVA